MPESSHACDEISAFHTARQRLGKHGPAFQPALAGPCRFPRWTQTWNGLESQRGRADAGTTAPGQTQAWQQVDTGARRFRRLFFRGGVPRVGRSFFEPGVPANEYEIPLARRSVTLFGYDQLRLRSVFLRRIGLVEMRTVNEQDHVGILFDGA